MSGPAVMTRTTTSGIPLAILLLAVVGYLALGAGQASASDVSCGDTITTDTKLDGDLVNCPNNGLEIGADDITLDLNGHMIDGDEPEACDEICDLGVANFDHPGVTIKGGSVREFALALVVVGSADNRLLDLAVTRNTFMGAVLADSQRAQFERNTVVANGLHTDREGLGLFASPHSRIARNSISDNGDIGVFAPDAEDVVFERNVLSGHPEVGMLIEGGRNNMLSRNRLSGNAVGIAFSGDGNVINRNYVADSRTGPEGGGLGIAIEAGHDNVVETNVVVRADKAGIQVSAPPDELEGGPPAMNTMVRNNLLRRNRDGVLVQETAEQTLLEGNLALKSGDDGIDVDSPATTLIGNLALHNADLGIEAVLGVTDGGDNKAHGNGNPAQCTNVTCN